MTINRLFIDLCFDALEAVVEGPIQSKTVLVTCSEQGGVFLTLDTQEPREVSASGNISAQCSPLEFSTPESAAQHPHAMFVDVSWPRGESPSGEVTLTDPARPSETTTVRFVAGQPQVELDGAPDGTRLVVGRPGSLVALAGRATTKLAA